MTQSLLLFTIFSVLHLLALIMSVVGLFEAKEYIKKLFCVLMTFLFSILISIDIFVILKSLK